MEIHFTVGRDILRGHLHTPVQRPGRWPGVLILPGFADTAVGPHNMHISMARVMARAGCVVLRFDYRGLGESDGDFRRFTAQSGYDDARAAIEVLRAQSSVDQQQLGVIGYSLGGALACAIAAEVPEIQALALLAPVAYPSVVFRTFFTAQHLEQGEQQGWIDWLGWPVGSAYLPSLDSFDPLSALQRSQAATLVLQGTADAEVPPENGAAYAARGATLQWLEGVDHQFASVVVQEDVIRRTCAWFLSCWS